MSECFLTRRGSRGKKLQAKTVLPSSVQQVVAPDAGYSGLSQVVVDGDADLLSANIRKGVSIFGVDGSLDAGIAVSDYAAIVAKTVAGVDCFCAKGSEMYCAENLPGVNTGIASFAIPSEGPWCVTISDGTRGRTGLVAISGLGEVRAIQLGFAADPVETDAGLILSPANGLKSGYTLGGGATMNGKAILENSFGGFWIAPSIDLTSYSKLTITGYLRSAGSNLSRLCIGGTSDSVFSPSAVPEMTQPWLGGLNQLYTASFSITNVTGAHYIGSSAVGNHLEITKILLST